MNFTLSFRFLQDSIQSRYVKNKNVAKQFLFDVSNFQNFTLQAFTALIALSKMTYLVNVYSANVRDTLLLFFKIISRHVRIYFVYFQF